MSESWTYEYAYPLHGTSPEGIFRALTDPDELQAWFAEHARIDARERGSFDFWGKHTVGTPAEGEAGGTITAYEPNERFAFEWTFFGVPSKVTISLSLEETDHGPATKVAIEHTFEGEVEMPRSRELVDDWWRFNLGNLMAHAADHGDVLRVDFDDPTPELRLSMQMNVSPDKVWAALTVPEHLNRWMAKNAKIDLREGGKLEMGWPTPEGYEGEGMVILELVEGRKLTFSWPDWRGDKSVPDQTITWLLEPEGEGTKVTLIHSGFVRTVDLSDYPFGWGYFMDQLRGVAEKV